MLNLLSLKICTLSSYSVYVNHTYYNQSLKRDKNWQIIPIKEGTVKESISLRITFKGKENRARQNKHDETMLDKKLS